MDTVLVTGATGLVGYHILHALLKRGRQVRALVRSLEKGKELLPEECELVQGDILAPESIRRAMQGCSVVYHAAGLSEQWVRDPRRFEQVNAGGTRNMVEAALALGVRRFIQTSTIDVFAGEAGKEFDESCLDMQPRSGHYGRSKQLADQQVAAAMARGLPAITLHPAGVYGPGPAGSPGLNQGIRALLYGWVPTLPPGGFPLVFAPDVGEGHVLAEECGVIGSHYILSEFYCTLRKVARILYEEAGMKRPIPPTIPLAPVRAYIWAAEHLAPLTHHPPFLTQGGLDYLQWQAVPISNKAQRELAWEPTPLREGMREMIAYLRSEGSWRAGRG